jgi:UDP-N-acetylmuramyl pentapeptide phosphotransferase/UDP-N-acetylglucosamine-1-phosphate transferase
MAVPGKRSSHLKKTPNLGGIAIFYGITVAASIAAYELFSMYIFLFAAIIILFFIGLMDDILVVAPDKKFYAQVIGTAMIAVGSNVRIDNFFGILGIEAVPYWFSLIFTIFVFVFLINAFNLIDGIDGLASGIAIVASLAFMFTFWRLGETNYPMIVFALTIIGSLLAFLQFNFAKQHKIFMGDTGSMIIGFLLSFMAVKFLNLFSLEYTYDHPTYYLPAAPAVIVAILIIPIIDTLCVSVIRIYRGHSPFRADKNHLHHRYLNLGLTHMQVSAILTIENGIVILVAYFFRHIDVHFLLLIVLSLGLIISFLPLLFNRRRQMQKNKITEN